VPVIGPGDTLTVTVLVIAQPVGSVYVINVVPVVTPVTTPDELPMVATAVVVLTQIPPDGLEVSVMDAVTQTAEGPVIAVGRGFTVTCFVTKHPVLLTE
jgi:hypothetical protein